MNFAWNTKKIKSLYMHPEHGRKIQVELPAIDILRDPNRHQIESIIAAMASTLVELVKIQEESVARFQELINSGVKSVEVSSAVPSGDSSKRPRRSKKSSSVLLDGGVRDPQSPTDR